MTGILILSCSVEIFLCVPRSTQYFYALLHNNYLSPSCYILQEEPRCALSVTSPWVLGAAWLSLIRFLLLAKQAQFLHVPALTKLESPQVMHAGFLCSLLHGEMQGTGRQT